MKKQTFSASEIFANLIKGDIRKIEHTGFAGSRGVYSPAGNILYFDDDAINGILGENITLEHNDFKYYYETEDEIVYFDVTLQNNKYIFTKTTGEPSSIRVYMKLDYAHKISDNLYLQYQVLFIKDDVIFSDANMNKLLSSDITQVDNYLYDGSVYRFIFQYNVLDYYIEGFDKTLREINEGGV